MQFGHTAVRSELSGHPEVGCGTGAWDKMLYGNHRFVVRVEGEAELVDGEGERAYGAPPAAGVAASQVILPWRRRDDDPWRFWANNGMEEATMIGHWASDAPIRSSNPEVLATTWLRSDGSAVVALKSWAAEPVDVALVFDGGATSALSVEGAAGLALSPVTVHPIEGFQTASSYGPGQPITLEPKRGLLLTIGKH